MRVGPIPKGQARLRRPAWWRIAIGLLAVTVVGFAQADASASGMRIAGTGSGLPILNKLLKAHRPDLNATLLNTGGEGGLEGLRDGGIDLAVTAREPSGEFATPAYKTVSLLRSPFIFVTTSANPAVSVSRSAIEALYAGNGRWPDGSIARVVLRPKLDIDSELLRAISPSMAVAVDGAMKREGLYVGATDTETLAAVERIAGSFAPSTLTLVSLTDYRVKILAYEGVTPSARALAQGTYPLGKTLWVTIRQPAAAQVEQFVAFLSSPPARRIVCDNGAIPPSTPCK